LVDGGERNLWETDNLLVYFWGKKRYWNPVSQFPGRKNLA